MFDEHEIFPIFMGTWVVLGIISFFVFFISKNAAQKRKLFRPFAIGVGVLFCVFVFLMDAHVQVFLFMVPAVTLITVINLRVTKFCDSCGRTIINNPPWSSPKYCSHCGSELPK